MTMTAADFFALTAVLFAADELLTATTESGVVFTYTAAEFAALEFLFDDTEVLTVAWDVE